MSLRSVMFSRHVNAVIEIVHWEKDSGFARTALGDGELCFDVETSDPLVLLISDQENQKAHTFSRFSLFHPYLCSLSLQCMYTCINKAHQDQYFITQLDTSFHSNNKYNL